MSVPCLPRLAIHQGKRKRSFSHLKLKFNTRPWSNRSPIWPSQISAAQPGETSSGTHSSQSHHRDTCFQLHFLPTQDSWDPESGQLRLLLQDQEGAQPWLGKGRGGALNYKWGEIQDSNKGAGRMFHPTLPLSDEAVCNRPASKYACLKMHLYFFKFSDYKQKFCYGRNL